MKILVGYDGAECSDAALDDLRSAGLPVENVEATIITIAEVWLPPPENETLSEFAEELPPPPPPSKAYDRNAKTVIEAETLAKYAESRLRRIFPAWRVAAEAGYGSAAWEIITKANQTSADLIVVGSHGRSAAGRLFPGSVSQKVLAEARCSVRISRGRVEFDASPSRIIIGYDGSPGAGAAIEAVAARNWRARSEVMMIAVSDPIMPSAIGRFVPPVADWIKEATEGEREWLEKLAQKSLEKLREAGLKTSLMIEAGNPKLMLARAAEQWHADSIFVGANRFGSRIEQFLLGSVAAAVAARARCTVEVVRKNVGI